jgi:acyl-coenzyme A synthetase/AMP-(fatty) acid ligase
MSHALPLLAPRELDAPLAWCRGQGISAALFIAEAQALAATLPERGRAVNLCQDRYRFALGLAAALLRGHTSLMPPNALPETLKSLADGGAAGEAYAFIDDEAAARALDTGGLATRIVTRPQGLAPARSVPTVAADLEAVRLLTSGSTGAPQPHAKRFGPLVANIAAEAERLAQHLGRQTLHGLTLVGTVPPQHSYGFESTVMLALLGGAAFEGGRPFYPADIADALAAVPEPRALVTTPFHLKTLLRSGVALPRAQLALSATAPLSPQLAAEAEDKLGGPLVEIYGCTEAGQVASRRTTEGDSWQTLGALRIEARDDAFVVSGGHVVEPTPLADVLVLESATRFRLLGRANDLIHVAGKRSSLAHLNFHLNRVDGVEDGAFWLPDDGGDDGEAVVRPIAFVVAPTLTAAEVLRGLRAAVEAVFVPRRVVFVDALPREATGKLTTAALRAFAARALATRVEVEHDIEADHPAFDGHFPGRPVLPGVVLLSLVQQALAEAPSLRALTGPAPSIDQVKFLAAVRPGSRVTLQLQAGEGRSVRFEARVAGGVVARGVLAAPAAASA